MPHFHVKEFGDDSDSERAYKSLKTCIVASVRSRHPPNWHALLYVPELRLQRKAIDFCLEAVVDAAIVWCKFSSSRVHPCALYDILEKCYLNSTMPVTGILPSES